MRTRVSELERRGAEERVKYEAIAKRNEETAKRTRLVEMEAHKFENRVVEIKERERKIWGAESASDDESVDMEC